MFLSLFLLLGSLATSSQQPVESGQPAFCLLLYPKNLTSSLKSSQSCISANIEGFILKELLHDLIGKKSKVNRQIKFYSI